MGKAGDLASLPPSAGWFAAGQLMARVRDNKMKQTTDNKKSWVQIHDLNCDPPRVYVAKCRDDANDSTDASIYDEVMRHDETITMGMVIGCPFRYAS